MFYSLVMGEIHSDITHTITESKILLFCALMVVHLIRVHLAGGDVAGPPCPRTAGSRGSKEWQ